MKDGTIDIRYPNKNRRKHAESKLIKLDYVCLYLLKFSSFSFLLFVCVKKKKEEKFKGTGIP